MILVVHHISGKQMNISKWNKRMVPYSITIYFVSSFYPFKFSLLRDIHEQSSDCVQPYFTTFFFLTNININLNFTLIIKLASLFGLMVFNKTKYIHACVKQAGLFFLLWIKCNLFDLATQLWLCILIMKIF